MAKQLPPSIDDKLRRFAEQRLQEAQLVPGAEQPWSSEQQDAGKLLHELQVHQIELELQNAELIEARTHTESALARYTELNEFAPVGYLTLTDDGLIAEANLTAATLLGMERGTLRQRRFSTLVAPDDRGQFDKLFVSAMQHGQRQAGQLVLLRGDGSMFPAHVDWWRTAGSEAPVSRITLTDISDLRRAEAAIHCLNRTLAASNQELEAFSYSVSHDLRAPLRALNGYSVLLAQEYAHKLDETGQQYLAHIRAATVRMDQLIDDMIDLARISRQELQRVEVNLSALAEEILAALREQQPQRAVSWTVAPNLAVRADPVLMRALLENLLSNAWKFTAERADGWIEFGRTQTGGDPACFVKDNGAGFDMTFANKLFKPFERLHSGERFAGTGIGLAIVERVVRRHGGRVWAEGSPGKGATFWFTCESGRPGGASNPTLRPMGGE